MTPWGFAYSSSRTFCAEVQPYARSMYHTSPHSEIHTKCNCAFSNVHYHTLTKMLHGVGIVYQRVRCSQSCNFGTQTCTPSQFRLLCGLSRFAGMYTKSTSHIWHLLNRCAVLWCASSSSVQAAAVCKQQQHASSVQLHCSGQAYMFN